MACKTPRVSECEKALLYFGSLPFFWRDQATIATLYGELGELGKSLVMTSKASR